jgi:riboflavin biosynthesis pyrimidine reductase
MTSLTPIESLYELKPGAGVNLPLPPELSNLYGPLEFSAHLGRPYLIANFVETLDGVVSLGVPGHSGGGEISGFNPYDRMVMGLLRAVADAVIVGAGTLRSVPDHLWTAAYAFPNLAEPYQALRIALGKAEPPLNVIVTARGEIDLSLRVFKSGEVPALIVTTASGEKHIRQQPLPPSVQIAVVEGSDVAGQLGARAILSAIKPLRQSDLILIEGGPQLMASFFAEKCLNELFLTFAPQIAGRDSSTERPGFIAGKRFAPEQQLWGTLAGVKRAGSHLFFRYSFNESAN